MLQNLHSIPDPIFKESASSRMRKRKIPSWPEN
jgi:hypothetical protein